MKKLFFLSFIPFIFLAGIYGIKNIAHKKVKFAYFKLVKVVDLDVEIQQIFPDPKRPGAIIYSGRSFTRVDENGNIKWQRFFSLMPFVMLKRDGSMRVILSKANIEYALELDPVSGIIIDTIYFSMPLSFIFFSSIRTLMYEDSLVLYAFNRMVISIEDKTFFRLGNEFIGGFPIISCPGWRASQSIMLSCLSGMNWRTFHGMTDYNITYLMFLSPITFKILKTFYMNLPYGRWRIFKRLRNGEYLTVVYEAFPKHRTILKHGWYHQTGYFLVDPDDLENPIKKSLVFHKWYMLTAKPDLAWEYQAENTLLPAVMDFAHRELIVFNDSLKEIGHFSLPSNNMYYYTMPIALDDSTLILMGREYNPAALDNPRIEGEVVWAHQVSTLFLGKLGTSKLHPILTLLKQQFGAEFSYDFKQQILYAAYGTKLYIFKVIFKSI